MRTVPHFFLPEQLPRILGSRSSKDADVIKGALNRKYFDFRPVYSHRIKDVFLIDGSFYASKYRYSLRSIFEQRFGWDVFGQANEFEHRVLGSTSAGSSWWGHWIEDEVPLRLLAAKFGKIIVHDRKIYRDEIYYNDLLNLPDVDTVNVAFISNLTIIDEFAQNPDKTMRYWDLKARAKKLPALGNRIFLSRGSSGSRRILINEQIIKECLAKQGFHILDIDKCDASEIAKTCRGAEIVVSVEGSHIAPLLYLIEDFGSLLILNPPQRVETTVADIGTFCGISCGMFICQPCLNSKNEDFYADPEELCNFIDKFEKYSLRNKNNIEDFLHEIRTLSE